MNEKAKPSAGALKAAVGLLYNLDDRRGYALDTVDEDVKEKWRDEWAHIIDRETGVAELLEAAKDAEESFRHAIADAKAFRDPHADKLSLGISISSPWKMEMREERHAKLVAAIAKTEAK